MTPPAGYQLTWSDEFQGNELDLTKWQIGTAKRDDAQQTPDAVTVHNGRLRISTYSEDGINYTGFLKTKELFETTYGYFEAKIRFNDSPGEWCAFWMNSGSNGEPVGNAGAAGAEIDIMEHRATDDAGRDVRNQAPTTLHWDGYGKFHKFATSTAVQPAGARPLQGDWHTYGLLWTPSGYTFFLDGSPKWNTAAGLSHRPEYLLLTCEVHDRRWAGRVPSGGYGPRAKSSTGMDVAWVKVWQKPEWTTRR
jgi:beta-glucanase (GH16 family)